MNDGPLRDQNDPVNREFIAMLERNEVPPGNSILLELIILRTSFKLITLLCRT